MMYGTTLMPSLSVLLASIIIKSNNRNILYCSVYLVSLILLIIYGNRGALICHLIMIGLWLWIYFDKGSIVKKNIIFTVVLIVGFLLNFYFLDIAYFLAQLIIYNFTDGIPYAIENYINYFILGESLDSFSSNRVAIWELAIESIKENFFFGNYIGFIHEVASSCHNILLEIMADYGILVFCAFIIFLFICIRNEYSFARHEYKYIMMLLISVSCIQLFSGYMFLDMYIMFFIGTLLSRKFSNENISMKESNVK